MGSVRCSQALSVCWFLTFQVISINHHSMTKSTINMMINLSGRTENNNRNMEAWNRKEPGSNDSNHHSWLNLLLVNTMINLSARSENNIRNVEAWNREEPGCNDSVPQEPISIFCPVYKWRWCHCMILPSWERVGGGGVGCEWTKVGDWWVKAVGVARQDKKSSSYRNIWLWPKELWRLGAGCDSWWDGEK